MFYQKDYRDNQVRQDCVEYPSFATFSAHTRENKPENHEHIHSTSYVHVHRAFVTQGWQRYALQHHCAEKGNQHRQIVPLCVILDGILIHAGYFTPPRRRGVFQTSRMVA